MTVLCTRRAATVVVGLLVLTLAACSNAGGETFAFDTARPPADLANLAPSLLVVEDITLAGWVAEPPSDDGPTVDDETGGICTFDFTEAMTADQLATEQDSTFSNQAQATVFVESLWLVPAAGDLVASMATQLASCVGAYSGTSGDSAVVVTSNPLDVTVPGGTTSVCRTFQTVIGDGTPLYGAMCLSAFGNRLLGVMAATPDPAGGITQVDFTTLVAAAAGKAFTG